MDEQNHCTKNKEIQSHREPLSRNASWRVAVLVLYGQQDQ